MATKKNEEKQTTTAMVLRDNGYSIAKFDPEQLRASIVDNLEGEDLRPTDLTRIKVPASGGRAFV